MTTVDMTELRELRERLRGAEEDKRVLREQLRLTREMAVMRDRQLEEITAHRNRLLEEKDVAWGRVLAPDTIASEVTAADPPLDPEQLPLLDERSELEC